MGLSFNSTVGWRVFVLRTVCKVCKTKPAMVFTALVIKNMDINIQGGINVLFLHWMTQHLTNVTKVKNPEELN